MTSGYYHVQLSQVLSRHLNTEDFELARSMMSPILDMHARHVGFRWGEAEAVPNRVAYDIHVLTGKLVSRVECVSTATQGIDSQNERIHYLRDIPTIFPNGFAWEDFDTITHLNKGLFSFFATPLFAMFRRSYDKRSSRRLVFVYYVLAHRWIYYLINGKGDTDIGVAMLSFMHLACNGYLFLGFREVSPSCAVLGCR